MIGTRGVKIKEIVAGEGAVQAEGIFDGSIEQDKWFVAGYGFAVQPAAIKVTIEKVTPRFQRRPRHARPIQARGDFH